MAWRIDENVNRGEIDNRVKGIVSGKLWLAGYDKPVTLDLVGNACPDLAGGSNIQQPSAHCFSEALRTAMLLRPRTGALRS